MNSGVLVYLFFFIVVAIVQGIGQKKKETQRRERQAPPEPVEGEGRETSSLPPERVPRPAGSPTREVGKAPRRESSEGMVPQDVWEEILGLARGEPARSKAPPEPVSAGPPRRDQDVSVYRAPGSLEEIPEFEARSLEDTRPRTESGESIAPREPVRGDRSPRDRPSRVRKNLFRDGSVEELRRAIILKEVLGPPLSLRDEEQF